MLTLYPVASVRSGSRGTRSPFPEGELNSYRTVAQQQSRREWNREAITARQYW